MMDEELKKLIENVSFDVFGKPFLHIAGLIKD